MQKQECRDRDITVEPTDARVIVKLDGEPIVETSKALILREGDYPPVYYLPADALPAQRTRASEQQTYCPFKGYAAYYHLKSEKGQADNAAWYYPNPCPLVADIARHVAFWGDRIEVSVS